MWGCAPASAQLADSGRFIAEEPASANDRAVWSGSFPLPTCRWGTVAPGHGVSLCGGSGTPLRWGSEDLPFGFGER